MPKSYHEDGVLKKFCPKCECVYKDPKMHFTKNKTEPDGLFHYCRSCKIIYEEERRQSNPERSRAYANKQSREWHKKNHKRATAYRKEYEQRPEPKMKRQAYDRRRKQTDAYKRMNNASARRVYARNPEKGKEATMRRRALKKQTAVDPIDYMLVLQRDGMFCYICQQAIIDGQRYEYDHVLPLQRGGAHIIENIKVTHAVCNHRKNDRLLSELTHYDRRGP